ncbi:Thiosulfate sulfurtransferase rdl2, mitochondrial [Aspergillus melleus]|uniref:Thiosulfate sulfurtransferase rdl2, mitochondrial n=1 Tax=Aspergillus melleus TaxID=138277 RepID=A0ACC3BFF6_9EURO|nr:Thiosulfate sulfurtransferase rdl2, mitochondrial [Aspergillus melleus]
MIAKRPLTSLLTRGVQNASRTSTPAFAPTILSSSRSFSSRLLPQKSARWLPVQIQEQKSRQYPSRSIRWNSSGESSMRQWGFEDINASLPSTSASSPPSTPQKSLILVDVREPAELTATGVIPSAVCVPLGSQPDALFLTPDEFETRFGFPKPGAVEGQETGDIVFYCKAGVRARMAAQLAVKAGYDPERVGVYGGSWLDWAGKGGKAEKWEGEDYE